MSSKRKRSDDVDSSDVEVEDHRSHRFSHYGKDSIEALLENATAVRLQSKKDFKAKKDFSLRPSVQATYDLWSNRFEAFRTDILSVPVHSPLSGQDIERTLTSYARSIVAARDGQPLQVRWATGAVGMMVNWARANIKDYKGLDAQERSSLTRTIAWLEKEDILTRELWKPKFTATLGISAVLVRRYLLSTVLDNRRGPQPSTRLLSVCAAVVLLVATAARSGDLALSNAYSHGDDAWQFLRYSHVQIRVVPTDGVDIDTYSLDARITLVAEKFKKDSKSVGNREITFSYKPSASSDILFMNPLLWVILLGIRSGNLDGTYENTLRAAAATPTGMIKWKFENRPVFHQFTTRCEPVYDKPATVITTINAVHSFMQSTQVKLRVTPHAFRRGGLDDVQNCDNLPTHNERHAQQVGGHSHHATFGGLTKMYSGDQRVDYMSLRLEQQDRLQNHFNPLHQAIQTSAHRFTPTASSSSSFPPPIPAKKKSSTSSAPTGTAEPGDSSTTLIMREVGSESPGIREPPFPRVPKRTLSRSIPQRRPLEDSLSEEDDDDGEEYDSLGGAEPVEDDDDEECHPPGDAYIAEDAASDTLSMRESAAIGTQLLLTETQDAGGLEIEQELPVLLNDSNLDALQTASAFVDAMTRLPEEARALGPRKGLYTVASPKAVDLATAKEQVGLEDHFTDGNRCKVCYRIATYKAAHMSICALHFTPAFWETPKLEDGTVTYTCKSCRHGYTDFAAVKYHNSHCRKRTDDAIEEESTTFSNTSVDLSTSDNTSTDLSTSSYTSKNPPSIQGVSTDASAPSKKTSTAEVSALRCPHCPKNFGRTQQKVFEKHIRKEHPESAPPELDTLPPVGGDIYTNVVEPEKRNCPYCPKTFMKNMVRPLEKHIRAAHPGSVVPDDVDSHVARPFVCPHGCKGRHERFTSQARLALHLRAVHNQGGNR